MISRSEKMQAHFERWFMMGPPRRCCSHIYKDRRRGRFAPPSAHIPGFLGTGCAVSCVDSGSPRAPVPAVVLRPVMSGEGRRQALPCPAFLGMDSIPSPLVCVRFVCFLCVWQLATYGF